MKKITIFTPTYNRGELLKKCYHSLKNQTNKEFIWQIIDDGSTDNTQDIVQKFIAEQFLDIVYIKKVNGGKVRAINDSLASCQTKLWMCLDSDDYLTENAIETIIFEHSRTIDDDCCVGLLGVRYTPDLYPMQGRHFKKIIDKLDERIKYCDFRYKKKIPPEYIFVFRTEIVKQYVYPIHPSEKFMSESNVYCLMNRKYHYLLLKKPVMVCRYQSDGLTNNHKKHVINNPKGYTYTHGVIADTVPYVRTIIRSALCYQMGRFMGGEKYAFSSMRKNIVVAMLKPAGYLAWKIYYSGQKK